ncbi:MAG TPA: hypothetical protein VK151_12530 [Fluviicola sp.]|nr:hypothetical protein [Fluviicola sp.]
MKQRFVYGVSVSTVFSGYGYPGINPGITLDFGKHTLSLSSRIPFSGLEGFSKERSNQIVLATYFQYRYRLMERWKKIRPFAFATAEYGFDRYYYNQSYDHTQFYSYGPIFNYSFDYTSHHKMHEFTLYTGLGIEASIWNGFYCFLNGGAGYGYSTGEQHWVETASGNTVYSQKLNAWPWDFRWMASVGIGFRYYPKQTREERREYRQQKRAGFSSPE